MSDVNIPKQNSPPQVGSIVSMRGYLRIMVVVAIVNDFNQKPFAASVVWLDDEARPCHATYPLECLDLGEE